MPQSARSFLKCLSLLGLLFAMLTIPQRVNAELWGAVDDRLLRSDIELLADYGVIRGPLATWPINWSQVRGALANVNAATLPVHVRDAFIRVNRLTPSNDTMKKGWSAEIDVAVTNEQAIIRGYGAQARGDYDTQARFINQFGKTHLSLSVGFQDEPFGRDVTFDNAYIAQEVGNWIAYAGTVERWWSPGWTSSLIFSTSARPQPQVGFRRNRPDPFKSKWLSWIGPWSFDAFISLQDESTGRFDNDIIAGLRIEIQPFKGLTFAGKRAIQLCGRGRPCSFNTWFDAIVVFGDRDNTGTPDEPGNQMAGIDFRYGNSFGNIAYSIYGEVVGEDEDNWFIGAYATLWGARFSGPWGDSGSRWEAIVEYSDTFSDRSFFDPQRPNITYQNFIYNDGWRYRGRSLGASQDNDTRLFTFTGHLTDTRNRFYRLTFHHGDFNTDGTGQNTITLNNETINIVEAETIWPTRFGDVRAEVRLQDDEPNTPARSPFIGAFELSYQLRF